MKLGSADTFCSLTGHDGLTREHGATIRFPPLRASRCWIDLYRRQMHDDAAVYEA